MPQKVKKDPKIKSKSKIRIEITIGVDPKTVFEPFTNPKNSPLGPQKVKKTPTLSENQNLQLKKPWKIKVAQLLEYTPKCMENMTTSPRNVMRHILKLLLVLHSLIKRHNIFVTWLKYGRF